MGLQASLRLLLLLPALPLHALVPTAAAGHSTHHVVDGALLRERSAGLRVVLGPVTKHGRVLREAARWEAGFSNSYPSVFYDEGVYSLWYNSYLGARSGETAQIHWHWNTTVRPAHASSALAR